MLVVENSVIKTILGRRAIRAFEPVEIPAGVRERILTAACAAPSSFNIQPYRFYWIEGKAAHQEAARLCQGQSAAMTSSALVVAVADLGSWKETGQDHLAWMKEQGFRREKIADQERKTALGKWFFLQGWFGIFGFLKWMILRAVNAWKVIGTVPVGRKGMFRWATKSVSLACQNLMIAAEAFGLNTCPMEGFDGRRMRKFLGLSPKHHEVVMVIAIGKRSADYSLAPQWRRPLEKTVTYL